MSLSVLIVDDDPGVLFLHELIVRESGFSKNISTFNKASLALEFLERNKNNNSAPLIFLDINMPGMSGWKFLESLGELEHFDQVFVVMVTSSVNRADHEKAKSYRRVIGYVEKPLDLEECDQLKKLEPIKRFFENEKS